MRCRYCGLMDCDCNPQEIHKSKIEQALREIIAEEIADQIWSDDKIITTRSRLKEAYEKTASGIITFERFWIELQK